jgi:NADH:ubiquinone oxidoreductase subunit H
MIEALVKSLVIIFVMLTGFAYMTWIERKAMARLVCSSRWPMASS